MELNSFPRALEEKNFSQDVRATAPWIKTVDAFGGKISVQSSASPSLLLQIGDER